VLKALLAAAWARGDREVVLSAQRSAAGFYARLGFEERGPDFEEAGIAHVEMVQAALKGARPRKADPGAAPETATIAGLPRPVLAPGHPADPPPISCDSWQPRKNATRPCRWKSPGATGRRSSSRMMMFLAPALGVPHEEMLQDTLKSIVVSFAALGAGPAVLLAATQPPRRPALACPDVAAAGADGVCAWAA
jgi:hypothetical protein